MANEYLKRTPTSSGNRLKATWSFWVKRNKLEGTSASTYLFYAASGSGADAVRYNDDDGGDSLRALFWNGTNNGGFINYDKLRDTSSWQHYLIVYDSTLNTIDNFSNNDQTLERIKIFVNGRRMIETGGAGNQNTGVTENQLLTRWGNTGIVNALFAEDDGAAASALQTMDTFFVDGQALTPDVFGFYKQGKGYISVGSTQATDFRPGQWVPKTPRVIKTEIIRRGGFGVNGFYLPMNDSSNFGADFHTTPNSIITLKGEDLPQPRNGAPETTDAYVSQLRTDPYAANLVLAVPGISSGQDSGYGDYSADVKGSGSNRTSTRQNVSIATTAGYYGSAISTVDASDYLYYDLDGTDYGTNDFTFECWFYATSEPSNWGILMKHATNGSWANGITLTSKNNTTRTFTIYTHNGSTNFVTASSTVWELNQWHHVVAERYNNTLTLYVNGVAHAVCDVTGHNYSVAGTPATSAQYGLSVGAQSNGDYQSNGYFQDLRVYKGVAKYKGGFDVPKPYTPVGIATWRAVPDTTANNFATWNPLFNGIGNLAITDGNLTLTESTSSTSQMTGTIEVSSGKWYYESYVGANPFNGSVLLGIGPATRPSSNIQNRTVYRSNGHVYTDSGTTAQSGTTYTTNDIIGIAFDVDAKKLWFSKNGSWVYSGEPSTGGNTAVTLTLDAYSPFTAFDGGAGTAIIKSNFGQNPSFSGNTTAGTFTDSNGKGLFKYEPPSGFLALCEDNLPTPAISNPGEHFRTVLYIGDGNSGRSITGVGFKPDLVWIKSRNASGYHQLMDSVRGAGIQLYSNDTLAEAQGNYLTSFDNDGFSINYNSSGATNASGTTYTAWCWRAGAGTTSTNTDGSIQSVVSVNQDAGFSIVSWTGNATESATIGHQLGKAPSFVIVKNRNDNGASGATNGNWQVWHKAFTGQQYINLNLTNAVVTETGGVTPWGGTIPSNSVITLGSYNSTNGSSDNMIAYCWTEIEGFSKFGSYVGNASADGPFVYCGFKPALVLIKTTSGGSWVIKDSSRSPNNPNGSQLYANTSAIDDDPYGITDFLSNGFKPRVISQSVNASGETYIFAAWAESPFQTANSK